jgi:hypothetical protein
MAGIKPSILDNLIPNPSPAVIEMGKSSSVLE